MLMIQLQVATGITLFVLLVFQLAVGMRWLKLGRRRLKIHRWNGFLLVALAAAHGLNGLMLTYGFGLG